jgi:WD40 repeat protein
VGCVSGHRDWAAICVCVGLGDLKKKGGSEAVYCLTIGGKWQVCDCSACCGVLWCAGGVLCAGIISCLAFNPLEGDLFAAGSYSRCIGLFDVRTREQLLWLEGHTGGITQVLYCGVCKAAAGAAAAAATPAQAGSRLLACFSPATQMQQRAMHTGSCSLQPAPRTASQPGCFTLVCY